MFTQCVYRSPLGEIFLQADDQGLCGMYLEGQRVWNNEMLTEPTPVILDAMRWLDIYFSGHNPNFTPQLHLVGSSFQLAVWKILQEIPYGTTVTYGEIAAQLEKQQNRRISAQAVGGAVGRNPVSIIVPCHRVVGENGNLTGYAGGLDKKIALLIMERAYRDNFFMPK